MELHPAVEEFQAISVALDRQRKLKVLRRILKLIIIGFFIGRGSDKRIFPYIRNTSTYSRNAASTLRPSKAEKNTDYDARVVHRH